jgi:SAM-dependent methyltransferase
MNNNKFFLKKILSYIPFLDRFIRKIYYNYKYNTLIIPLDFQHSEKKILKTDAYKLNVKNFEKLKKNYNYFLISRNKLISNYPTVKLKKLIDLVKNHNADIAYDGDDFFYTEIVSKRVLESYSGIYPLKKYPIRFFYFKKNFNVKNIGLNHRSFNFNGTFRLPSGGRTIGDGGDVTNRLNFIPELKGKSFLDIGSEEGYSVFDALNKQAKFAKGLNINETREYDFFPDYLRPNHITSRKRDEIENTQKFLIKEYGLENSNKFEFEYDNIYNLKDEKFDFVFCFGILYHLKNPYLALENLFKITNETLIIETQGIKSKNYLNAKISEKDGFVRHSSKSLAFLLKRAGFKKIKILVDAYDDSMKINNIVLKATK